MNRRRLTIAATSAALVIAAAGCGGDDSTGDVAATSEVTTTDAPSTTTTAAPSTTEPAPTSTDATTTTTATVDDGWKDEAAAACAAVAAEIGAQPGPEASMGEVVAFWRDLRDRLPWLDELDLPDELRNAPTDLPAVMRRADDHLASAEAAVGAGDDAAADRERRRYTSLLEHSAALVTVAGAACADPARAANASLNVPVPSADQLAVGFGSVWVSQSYFDTVVRVDPDSGEVLATIDVGESPFKAQPADGRMIVRGVDAYTAIDPATDTVVATLPKSEVGPAANRSWAIDGAMWICDGPRVHRYDPATFEPTGTTIELDIDCGQVYATPELVIAWVYNDDPGESGIAAAAFIDPATDEVLATTPLPVDVTVPIVLDDTVYFPGNFGTQNVVVDRSTWAITATPDYGREVAGSEMTYDGQFIYLIADKDDVLVVDAESFEVTDTIEPLFVVDGINALAYTPGALWTVNGDAGILQRFDTQ
jgi:hypothetical protein